MLGGKLVKLIFTIVLGSILLTTTTPALSDHTGFAPCLAESGPTSDPPSGVVVVRIISVDPNTDMEGDDDNIPFYDNKADLYGEVVIGGVSNDLPKINETDNPHWDNQPADDEHPRGGVFSVEVPAVPDSTGLTPLPVPISIRIAESDGGLTGDDDSVDINPASDKRALDIEFDMCSLRVSGDINVNGSQGVLEASGGDGDGAALIRFTVGLEDGRPVSVDDAALTDLDFVQVVPRVGRLVAEKPTVLMARVVNNYQVEISPKLRVHITGIQSPALVDEFDLGPIGAGEVKKFHLYANAPLLFPKKDSPYTVRVTGRLDPDGELPDTGHSVADDCRAQNNGGNNRIAWSVVGTSEPSLLWAKVGMDLDIGNFAPDSHFQEIRELGEAYIRGVFPLASVDQSTSPVDIPVLITPGFDWLRAIIPGTDAADPFLVVAELGGIAALLGYDRILGVLPNKDWFERFEGWGSVTGVSLGDAFPGGVIFVPRKESSSAVGPAMVLAAHELGHTYGLSVDSSIKPKWACSLDMGTIGTLICGMNKGFDEYQNEISPYDKGNPARGYWITQGAETAAVASLLDSEQCDSHCFMGSTRLNSHLDWPNKKSWIDGSDYDKLLDELQTSANSSSDTGTSEIYLSGMLALQGTYELSGREYTLPQDEFNVLDAIRISSRGRPSTNQPDGEEATIGRIQFQDEQQRTLSTESIPLHFLTVADPSSKGLLALPVSGFGATYPMPADTRRIAFFVHAEDKGLRELGSINVSPSPPRVTLHDLASDKLKPGEKVPLNWEGYDPDGDELSYSIAISPDHGAHWWPVALDVAATELGVDTAALQRGKYAVKVIAHDGVNTGESEVAFFSVAPQKY